MMWQILGQTTQPAVDALDVLTKVDAFYDSAWTKLLWTVSVAGFIIAIVLPIVLQLIQSVSTSRIKDTFAKEVEDATKQFEAEVVASGERVKDELDRIRAKWKEDLKDMEIRREIMAKEFERAKAKALGGTFQAIALAQSPGEFPASTVVMLLLTGVGEYIVAGDLGWAEFSLSSAAELCKKKLDDVKDDKGVARMLEFVKEQAVEVKGSEGLQRMLADLDQLLKGAVDDELD